MVSVRQKKSKAVLYRIKNCIIHSSSLLGMTQLMAGGGIALIGGVLVPVLGTLFG